MFSVGHIVWSADVLVRSNFFFSMQGVHVLLICRVFTCCRSDSCGRGCPRSIIKAVKGACPATSELQDDAGEAEEDTEEGAGEDLPEGVLTKEHTAAAHEAWSFCWRIGRSMWRTPIQK